MAHRSRYEINGFEFYLTWFGARGFFVREHVCYKVEAASLICFILCMNDRDAESEGQTRPTPSYPRSCCNIPPPFVSIPYVRVAMVLPIS